LKKILLISPYPPAQNPRLVKEYETLKQEGFYVKVLFAERDKWASVHTLAQNTDFIRVGGKYGSVFYYFSRIIHKLIRNIFPFEFGYNRVSLLLYLKAMSIKSDLYIGHNLASLPLVVKLAKRNYGKCGFDAEDFHRNEVTDTITDKDVKLKTLIEDKYIQQIDYFTAASPLIAKSYKNLYPKLNPIIINNVFKKKYQPILNLANNKSLKLFWFSQTIGTNRGLEDVIRALNSLNNPMIELHLLGNVSTNTATHFKKLAIFKINYHAPISGNRIFNLAAKCDIGLALEPGFCLNNKIALSNKIFTYLISGLAVIASDTLAQKKFLTEYPLIGMSYPIGDIQALAKTIDTYDKNRNLLNEAKTNSHQLAKLEFNWEKESFKFIQVIDNVLNN